MRTLDEKKEMKMFDEKAWRKEEKAEELLFSFTEDKRLSCLTLSYSNYLILLTQAETHIKLKAATLCTFK